MSDESPRLSLDLRLNPYCNGLSRSQRNDAAGLFSQLEYSRSSHELDQPESAKEREKKTVIALAFVTVFASSAFAQKPVKERFVNEPIEFGAGDVCAFPVHILGDGKQNSIHFPSGRDMIVGQGSITVTNVATGASIELTQSGRYVETLLADGTVKIETNGQILFFLLPQDVGGPALTLATGHFSLDLRHWRGHRDLTALVWPAD